MDNNEKGMNKLDLDDLDKVAGGKDDQYAEGLSTCFIAGCDGPAFIERRLYNNVYKAWRCKKCGHEYFERDGFRLSPSDFYKEIIIDYDVDADEILR